MKEKHVVSNLTKGIVATAMNNDDFCTLIQKSSSEVYGLLLKSLKDKERAVTESQKAILANFEMEQEDSLTFTVKSILALLQYELGIENQADNIGQKKKINLSDTDPVSISDNSVAPTPANINTTETTTEIIVRKTVKITEAIIEDPTKKNVETNVKIPIFLQELEKKSIVYRDGITITDTDLQFIYSIFKHIFNCQNDQHIKKKLVEREICTTSNEQTSLPRKHIIESLYTMCGKSRPKEFIKREDPTVKQADLDEWVGKQVNLYKFLNIQNLQVNEIAEGEKILGNYYTTKKVYYNNKENLCMVYTVGKDKNTGNFITVLVKSDGKNYETGIVQKLHIISIESNPNNYDGKNPYIILAEIVNPEEKK